MKKIFLFAAMAFLTFTATAQVKFAYVDFNELVMLMPEADAARTQMQAAQMVEENEITQRAQARAVEMTEAAQQESARIQQETMGTLSQLLEHADIGLSAQLDALRTMRQQLGAGYIDADQQGYMQNGYQDDGYNV